MLVRASSINRSYALSSTSRAARRHSHILTKPAPMTPPRQAWLGCSHDPARLKAAHTSRMVTPVATNAHWKTRKVRPASRDTIKPRIGEAVKKTPNTRNPKFTHFTRNLRDTLVLRSL
jgi:hypothetical protein